ncbi:MAG: response regulator transcription factor [Bacteroidia bacterium]|nr:response regulator transcription factor [Bacteroidia bacterium]
MPQVSILLADAQHIFRNGLKLMLEEMRDMLLIGEAENSDQLVKLLAQTPPDMVIIDYNLPGYFCRQDIAQIRLMAPETQIVIISSDQDKQNIYHVLESGVAGYLTKECGTDEIMLAIRLASRGEKFFCNKVLNIILEKKVDRPDEDCTPTVLTAREMEITALIARGIRTENIAEKLCLSVHTIRTHRKNILKKLKIKSVSGIILHAIQTGLIGSEQANPPR